ncbi:MAG: STAS domain-containing protein [Acidimicrobiia bacterium]
MAALSVDSMQRASSRAQVIGRVGRDNAEWLLGLLRELEGDVTLDCRHSSFVDSAALMVLVDFDEFLRSRGNSLTICGVPDGAAAAIPTAASVIARGSSPTAASS